MIIEERRAQHFQRRIRWRDKEQEADLGNPKCRQSYIDPI